MNVFNKSNTSKFISILLVTLLMVAMIGCTKKADNTVPVTGITLQSEGNATFINTHLGTLQFTYVLSPDDATNKLVTWSVTNGTGEASITQLGLLTAEADGTVTVKVTSKSDTSISAEQVITISNQVVDNTAPLASALVNSNDNVENTNVGTNSDEFVANVEWVTAANKAAYVTAINEAQATLNSAPLTELEVTNAVNALNQATQTFNASKQNGTKVVANINLGSANDFVILSKTGVSTTGTTAVVGNIGVSPVTASYITGFGLIMDSGNEFATSSLVTGKIYAADYTVPTPSVLTSAIEDMLIAYNDGTGRTPDYTELYTGDLSGKTLTTGVYKWSNDVLINTDLTLNGSATEVFIFQIAGTMSMAANTQITLTGGLLAENIYWVVADTIAIDVGASFMGTILSMTNVSMNTNSSILGNIYAQTSISFDATAVTKPE